MVKPRPYAPCQCCVQDRACFPACFPTHLAVCILALWCLILMTYRVLEKMGKGLLALLPTHWAGFTRSGAFYSWELGAGGSTWSEPPSFRRSSCEVGSLQTKLKSKWCWARFLGKLPNKPSRMFILVVFTSKHHFQEELIKVQIYILSISIMNGNLKFLQLHAIYHYIWAVLCKNELIV